MYFAVHRLALAACFGLHCIAAEPASISETRGTLEKWVETRQILSRTKTEWQSDKERLEQTIKLFEREMKSVDDQMSKLSTNNVQVETERNQAEELQNSSRESLVEAGKFAGVFESQIAALVPRLPTPLQEILKPLLSRIPADPANTRMTAAERIQVIVGILNELDKFNNGVAIFSERRKNPAGEEMSVETVYVGLGAAYFVNDADNFAGLGTPGHKGWEWTVKPELASPVREIIRIYRNERPARFVALPATIK